MPDLFRFNAEQFNRLFPFFILIEREKGISAMGRSLQKILKLQAGTAFGQAFVIKRPQPASYSFQHLVDLQDQLMVLEAIDNKEVILRGQFEYMAEQDSLLFVGSPWFGSMDNVRELGLVIKDFAFHDPLIDLLHVLKTQEIVTEEIKQLLTTVNKQKNDLKKTEAELKTTALRLSNLIINMRDGILLEDEHRSIVITNQTFVSMFGIPAPPEALIGMDCSGSAEQSKGLFKDPEGFVQRIDELLQERKIATSDEMELADGRYFERDYIPLYIGEEYHGHLWKYRDITERKMAENKIRNQEEKYRNIITNMNLGLVEVDQYGIITFANQSFCNMSGYELDELIGKVAGDILLKGENKELLEEKRKERYSGKSDSYEIAVKNKRGELRWWLVSGGPRYNDRGEFVGSTGIHLDITEQKALESELIVARQVAEESSKAKEIFLANMSHEIRTPMNVILALGRHLQKSTLNRQQRFYMDSILSATDNLLVIVNDILDISKIEAGKLSLEEIGFSPRSLVNSLQVVLKHRAEEKGLLLESQVDSGIAKVLVGDPHRINQILMNLLGNALKFTEHGKVSLHWKLLTDQANEQSIGIEVRDTGKGMNESFLANLFNKFEQEDSSIGREFGGTGLGMSICKQLVELMGGSIEVNSHKNEGTAIQVNLLLPKGEEKDLPAKKTSIGSTGQLKNMRILLVEDNPMNRLVASTMLQAHEVILTEAEHGEEALQLLAKNEYDLVLMDVRMPVMDGLEATRHIRRDLSKTLPVIAITANAIKGEADKCLEAGMNDYLSKPYTTEQLLSMIIKWSDPQAVRTNKPQGLSKKEATPASGKSTYNLAILYEVAEGNQDFVKKMLQLFIREVPARCAEMLEAQEKGDMQKLQHLAHRIKPSIDNMGIHGLQKEIRQIEQAAAENRNTPELKKLVQYAWQVIEQVQQDLKQREIF